MTRFSTALVVSVLAGTLAAEAGEIVLRSGAQLEGETANDVGDPGRSSLAAYPDGSGSAAGRSGAAPGTQAGGPTLASVDPQKVPTRGETLEVVAAESVLYRDAYAGAKRVGRVAQGQLVVYLDRIDRRLRILDVLVFDGGYWVKVRAAHGAEGWIPASAVREAW